MKKYFIGVYDYTVVLTYISLASAVLGIIQASRGNFAIAVGCVLFSGLCDAFDGAVARTKKNRTEDEKSFGIQLDSICDVISFGVAPAMICYFRGVNRGFDIVIILLYILTALIRLAFFNVLEIKRQKTEDGAAKYYRGLPVTSISIILPVVYAFDYLLKEPAYLLLLRLVLFVVAVFFVLDVKVKKLSFDKLLLHKIHEESELVSVTENTDSEND